MGYKRRGSRRKFKSSRKKVGRHYFVQRGGTRL